MNLIASLMKLQGVIDDETKALFTQFCIAAIGSGEPNVFVKNALRAALEPPKEEKPAPVDVEVIDVK